MIPYMVSKIAPNSLYLTRGLVKYVPGRGYFRAVPSQNGDKYVSSPFPPIVELVFRVLPYINGAREHVQLALADVLCGRARVCRGF